MWRDVILLNLLYLQSCFFFCLNFLDWYCHFGLSQCETYRNLNTRLDAGNGLCGADDQCYCYRGYSGNTCLDASYTDYSSCGYRCTFDQGLCEVSVTWMWEVDTLKFWVTAWFWTSSWIITQLNFQAPHAFKWYLIRRDHCFRGVFAGTHLQQYFYSSSKWRSQHSPKNLMVEVQRGQTSKEVIGNLRSWACNCRAEYSGGKCSRFSCPNGCWSATSTKATNQKQPMDLVILSLPLIQGCTKTWAIRASSQTFLSSLSMAKDATNGDIALPVEYVAVPWACVDP